MLILRAINSGRCEQKNNFIEALTRASFLAYPILFIILIMLQRLMLKIKYISHL
jgi:hypothetical protein